MSGSGGYWKWDEKKQDYYHAEWNPSTRNWSYSWARDVTPTGSREPFGVAPTKYRSPPSQPSPAEPPFQPLDPYGSSRQTIVTTAGDTNYVYSRGRDQGFGRIDNLSRNMANLGLDYNQQPQTNRHQQQVPTYVSSQNRRLSSTSSSRPAIANPTSYANPSNIAAGKRPVWDNNPQFNIEEPPNGQTVGALAHNRMNPGQGSSLDMQTSAGMRTNLIVDPKKERLDPGFKVRRPPKDFFIQGRVFYTLFTQPAGSGGDTHSADFTQVKYGELAHTQIRRLVVVKNVPKEYFSFCLPITTYQGRGATKHGIDQRSHTIVFSGPHAPPKLPGEDKMNKVPLKVDLFSPSEKLDEKSRINLGKPYPIEWNVKVKEIGQLDRGSTQKMIAYWKDLTTV